MINSHIFPIIKLLADGHFHSGETIARQFHVSRATIWNAIQEAEKLGIRIFSVRGRGYKLAQSVTLLEKTAILNAFTQLAENQNAQPFNVEVHDHLPSTNRLLMEAISQHKSHLHGTCVVANLQTQGRGRRGRSWQAGLGESLTFSVLWQFQCGAAGLSGLSLAVGVAIMRALHQLGATEAKLKWPNDIVVKNQTSIEKLAGILIELQGDMEGPSTAVIGIGINLNLSNGIKSTIDQAATDVASITHQTINPNLLLAALLQQLADILFNFEQFGFAALRKEWLTHHAYHQQQVKMCHPNGTETVGIATDVAEDGVLIVSTPQGLQRFSSGEISLRGVIN
jgi:BirA family biotin operon repressor/biotin-[acetyl-CoA-carboxylase] ligase